MRQLRILFRASVLLSCLAVAVGCDDTEPIVKYEVPKHEAIQQSLGSAESVVPEGDPTDRMLAGIVLTEDTGWFVKASGGVDQYPEDATEQFDQFLSSIDLSDEKPKWELPEAWKELPGSGIRLATLEMGDIEISVTRLGRPSGGERQYLLSNINRWRKQLMLPALDSSQLAQNSYKVSTADGNDVTVVDLLGHLNASSLPPMAGGGKGRAPFAGGAAPSPPRSTSRPEFKHKAPADWVAKTPGMMQSLLYNVPGEGGSADASVVRLGGSGGGLLNNVNRWRGQVGLDPLASEDDVDSQTVVIAERDAAYLRIDGSNGKAMLIAMAPRDGQVWFFKLLGEQSVVAKQESAFKDFLASIEFN